MHPLTHILFAVFLLVALVSSSNTTSDHAVADTKAVDGRQSETKTQSEQVVQTTPPRLLIMLQRKHPRVYLEVIKIREQIRLDSNNKEVSRNAIAAERLYRVHSDGTRHAIRSRLYMMSPEGHFHSSNHYRLEQDREIEEDPLNWFDRLALALHLEHFWPRLLFSLSAGFAVVSLGFLMVHLACLLLGYEGRGKTRDDADEFAALLDPHVRGPGVIRVPTEDKGVIEKTAPMETM